MPRQRFKKGITNFSKGYATYFGSLDIPDDIFFSLKNVTSFIGGKLLKSPLTSQITENNSVIDFTDGGNTQIFIYKPDWILSEITHAEDATQEENLTKSYYIVICQKATESGQECFLYAHEASDSDNSSASTITNSWLNIVDGGNFGWDGDLTVQPDFYVSNGNLRISDGNMNSNHKSKWFGHIKRDILGYNNFSKKTEGSDNYVMAPSPGRPRQATQINQWYFYDQHIKAPVSKKLLSPLDKENIVSNPGEIGIIVQDARLNAEKQLASDVDFLAVNPGDAYAYPMTIYKDRFHAEDRYATTFVYDYVSESELSRDEFGNIGVSGFDCFEPPDILEGEDDLIYEYVDDNGDKKTIHLLSDYGNNLDDNYIFFASEAQASVFKPLDVIRIASEKILMVKQTSNTPAWKVVRGVYNTSPVALSKDDDIYRVQLKQNARAVSIVLGTGALSAHASVTFGTGTIMAIWANKSLGSFAENIKLTFNYNSGITNNTANIGIRNYNSEGKQIEVVIEFKGFSADDFIDLINTGTVSGKTITYPGWDSLSSPDNQTYASGVMSKEVLQSFFTSSGLILSANSSTDITADVTATFYSGYDNETRVETDQTPYFLNKRITSIKLYWQPKGDPNWYLVNEYDIKKGLVDDPSVSMKKYFTSEQDCGNANYSDSNPRGTEGDFVEKSMPQSGNIGAWIETPFLNKVGQLKHYNDPNQPNYASNIRTLVCKSGFRIDPLDENYSDFGTVTNNMVATNGCIALISKATEYGEDGYNYISSSFYGTISFGNYGGYAKVNTSTLSAGGGGEWGKVAFFGGIPVSARKLDGDMTADIIFDKTANTVSFGASTSSDGFNEHLDNLGFNSGDFIFISTNTPGHPNNGLYKIKEADTLSDVINDDDEGTKRTLIHLDRDFREIAKGGSFAPATTPISGSKYLTNDLGCSFTNGTTGMQPPGSALNVSGVEKWFDIEVYMPRGDAIGTRRIPHYGFKDLIYQDMLDRSESFRFSEVRWTASTVINGQVVIGNVDIMDENEQTNKERSRILWTNPYKSDEFTLGKSRTVGKMDSDPIVGLEALNNALFVVKTKNSYICDPNSNFRDVQYLPGLGTPWKSSITTTPKGLIIANKKGIFLLPEGKELSLPIRDDFHKLTFSNPSLGFSVKTGDISFVPDTRTKNSQSRERYIINMASGAVFKEIMDDPYSSNQETTIGNFIEGETGYSEFLSSSQHGASIHRFVSTYNDSDGVAITDEDTAHTRVDKFEIESKDFTFDDPSQIKYLEYMYLTYKFGNNITLKIYADNKFIREIILPAHFTLQNRKIPIKAEGKTLKFKLIETENNSTKKYHLEIEDIIVEGYYTGKN